MKYTISTSTWKCPNCKQVVRTSSSSDMDCLIYVIFFPIVMLMLLFKWIIRAATKKNKLYTAIGEEVTKCRHCGKLLVLTKTQFGTMSRVVLSNEELFEIISPAVHILEIEEISCLRLNADKNVVENLSLAFINNSNHKRVTTKIYIGTAFYSVELFGTKSEKKLWLLYNDKEYEYAHQTLIGLVLNDLCSVSATE